MSDLRRARFARLVRNALDELPAEFRERIRNLEIVVEDEPPRERVSEGGTLLGLYEGVPLTSRGAQEPYLPDRICIFRGPIERMTVSPRRQAELVRDTVVHEVAHFERGALHIDTLGLQLAEAKNLLQDVQELVVGEQVRTCVAEQARCPCCGRTRRHKDSDSIVMRTLFGTLHLRSPRGITARASHSRRARSPDWSHTA